MLLSAGQVIAAAWAETSEAGVMVEFIDIRFGLPYKRILAADLARAEEIGRSELKRQGERNVRIKTTLPNGETVEVL